MFWIFISTIKVYKREIYGIVVDTCCFSANIIEHRIYGQHLVMFERFCVLECNI